MNPRVLGWMMMVFGIVFAVSYSYLVLYTQYSDEITKATLAATAILFGGILAGIGLALILGWKRYSEAKRKIREREEKTAGNI